MKKFLISVDTEGDNLWEWKPEKIISTQNTEYIIRFQEMCESFGFIPTYLTNYEMAMDDKFVSYFKKKYIQGKCEIGMHLHAWNSPPIYTLNDIYGGNPFITEYPKEIVYEKHIFLKQLLEERFQMPIISYRSGRWATNKELFEVLEEIGILVDCSVTPGITHSRIPGCTVLGGNDYTKSLRKPYKIGENLIELPMTTCLTRNISGSNLKKRIRHIIKGEQYWLRPIGNGIDYLNMTRNIAEKKGDEYLMFMLHSSELMPGGSPYFPDCEAVDNLYKVIENFFDSVKNNYEGMSIGEYGKSILKKYGGLDNE